MVDEDTPLGRLMHDFRCTRPEDMYYDVLAERVTDISMDKIREIGRRHRLL